MPLYAHILRSIAAQSPEEIARQESVLGEVEATRILLTIFAYLVAVTYLPLTLCMGLAALDTLAEWQGRRLLTGLDPRRQPWRYLGVHAWLVVAELSFAIPAGMLWQIENSFARALTIGMTATTLLQLMSVRCIHLPFAVTGWLTVLVVSLIANALVWLRLDNIEGLTLSTLVVLGTALFAINILVANHRVHDAIARERSAAQAADRAKSLFLTQMSHELRTPLNAIIGMGAIELSSSANAETRSRMVTLVQSARGLGTILDDILDLAAVREGRLPMRPADLDLVAEITSIAALFRPLAEAQDLALDLVVEPGVPPLARFDGQRLRQCLSNVLSNALKHTSVGGITVRLQAVPGQAAITISDTGSGIPDSVAAHLFEPFQQGPSAKAGTGLGLAISRQIARTMGGDLVLLSQQGGAQFHLTLRLDPPLDPGADPARSRPSTGTGRPVADLGGARVLVVDDIATNRLVATSYLKLLQARPLQAANADEALALILADAPQAVLLDMNMPEVDGIETFRRICRDAARRAIARPVVLAMTADATEDHRRAYLAAGLDGYVAKPIDLDALAAALMGLLPPLNQASAPAAD